MFRSCAKKSRLAVLLAAGLASLSAVPASAQPGPSAINCTIQPLRIVELSSQISGVVKTVFVKPGDVVAVGDKIVRLDDELAAIEYELARERAGLRSDLAAAEARREGIARKEARLADAYRQNAVSVADYEAASMDLASAEGDVRRERERLALAAIEMRRAGAVLGKALLKSPVAGVIGEDLVAPGESVVAQPIATIYVNRPLRIEAFVPIGHLSAFTAQPEHHVVVDGQHTVQVDFDYVAPAADRASNTVSVYFTLDQDTVLPGSRCELSLKPGAVPDLRTRMN